MLKLNNFAEFAKKFSTFLFLLTSLLILNQCASSKKMAPPGPKPVLEIPAGVDSSVAVEADSLAETLFVPAEQQKLAREKMEEAQSRVEESNRLWEALTAIKDSAVLSQVDTVQAIEKFNQGALHLIEIKKLREKGALNPQQLQQQVYEHLSTARKLFEEAVMLNPFDQKARLWLARVYQMLAKRFLSEQDLRKAAEILENLVRIEKGEHALYARLAQCYYDLGEWPKALKNFRTAEKVLLTTAIFNVPEDQPLDSATVAAAVDSTTLFLYVYYQGEVQIQLKDAQGALTSLYRALELAPDADQRKNVQTSIDWILWDDGNIAASEMRDSLLLLIDEQKYPEAARGFETLLTSLKTEQAKRETGWRLALLEYSFLNKPEAALDRMREIVRFYQNDTTGLASRDTLQKEYFNSYGTMCHNQGLAALSAKKYRRALAYFEQSARIPWDKQAKSLMEIAKLSINNPERAVQFAKQALAKREQLNPREKLVTMKILIESLKRTGNFEEATRWFKEYRVLASQLREKPGG